MNNWKSLELAVDRRLAHNWQARAAFSATKFHMLYAETGEQVAIPNDNPNTFFNQLNETWDWVFKAQGSYHLPFNFLTSANYQLIAGATWTKQALLTGGTTIPSITLNAEPFGSERLPSTSLLDVRVGKTIPLVSKTKLELNVDLYNALDVNTTQSVTARIGSSLGVPRSIVPPRIAMFSASLIFSAVSRYVRMRRDTHAVGRTAARRVEASKKDINEQKIDGLDRHWDRRHGVARCASGPGRRAVVRFDGLQVRARADCGRRTGRPHGDLGWRSEPDDTTAPDPEQRCADDSGSRGAARRSTVGHGVGQCHA